VTSWVWDQLSDATKALVRNRSGGDNERTRSALLGDLNRLIQAGPFYDVERFTGVRLSPHTEHFLKAEALAGEALARLNRFLLEDIFPYKIRAKTILHIDFYRGLGLFAPDHGVFIWSGA
jgi:hypothetical protein